MSFAVPILETERLIMRAPENGDLEAQAAFLASDRSHFVGGPKPLGGAWHSLTFMLGHWHMRGFGMWIVTDKLTKAAVGKVGHYFPVGWAERELGWQIWDEKHEGKGYAYEATIAARNFAYQTLGWKTQVSYIVTENTRSIALAERLGAAVDDNADRPDIDTPVVVYRHPAVEALS